MESEQEFSPDNEAVRPDLEKLLQQRKFAEQILAAIDQKGGKEA